MKLLKKNSVINTSLICNGTILNKYMRISKRFPHLNLKEIIEFDKKVRDNGGSIRVHRGKYLLCHRPVCSNNTHTEYIRDVYMSWTCCTHNFHPYNKPPIGMFPYLHQDTQCVSHRHIKSANMDNSIHFRCLYYENSIDLANPYQPYSHTFKYDSKNRDPSSVCAIGEMFNIDD